MVKSRQARQTGQHLLDIVLPQGYNFQHQIFSTDGNKELVVSYKASCKFSYCRLVDRLILAMITETIRNTYMKITSETTFW